MRVVLVAANQDLRGSLTAILETRGHEVAGFADPQAALDRLQSDREANAFIVVNSRAADDGAEICWEARLLASFERPIYICLVSRPLGSAALIEALDCGADDVLQLPLSPDELYARLRAAERFNQLQLQLVEMATRDGLTGLYNRPAFFKRAARTCDDSATPHAAIMIDIDHFKAINDNYGHAAGDRALRAVAECLKNATEIVGRLGGEEFALLLDHGDADRACRAAETLRGLIAALEIEADKGCIRVTCSFGVGIGAPGEDIDQILRKADTALYAAKNSGRNKVALYDPAKDATQDRSHSVVRESKRPIVGGGHKIGLSALATLR